MRFRLGDWRVEPDLNRVSMGETLKQLEPKVMDVLVVLARNAGNLTSRAALLEQVWGNAYLGEDPTTRAVSELRKALGDDPRRPRFIETIHGKGYRLVAEVADDVEDSDAIAGSGAGSGLPVGWAAAGLVLALVVLAILWWQKPQKDSEIRGARLLPVTSFPGREHHPAVSPDGSRVAFAWSAGKGGPLDIYVKQRNSEQLLQLTDTPAWEGAPVWSGDGTEVAFVRMTRDGSTVVALPAIGGPERLLHRCGQDFKGFDLSPDGNHMAVAERRPEDRSAVVYLSDFRDGSSRRLTDIESAQMEDTAPLFSGDGSRLAFRRKLGDAEYEMFVAEVDSGQMRQVTFDGEDNGGFAWSPDGGYLIVSSNRGGTFGLWKVLLAGGEPSWLGIDNAFLPSVARATGDLVFERRSDNIDIWRVPNPYQAHPSEASPWASSTFYDLDAAYSPDGARVAFVSSRSGSYELWLGDAHGSDLRRLTFFSKPTPGWSPAVQHPRWSPDGTTLVFSARAENDFDVFTLGVDGGIPRPLTSGLVDETSPVWMQDGRWIYYVAKRDGAGQLWRVRPDGGDREQVATGGSSDFIETRDGVTLFIASDSTLDRFDSSDQTRETVVESMSTSTWGLGKDAVYIISAGALVRVSLATGAEERRDLVSSGTPAGGVHIEASGVSLPPDDAWILYTGISQSESDLMIAESFLTPDS